MSTTTPELAKTEFGNQPEPDTSTQEIDKALQQLDSKRDAFLALSIDERIDLVDTLIRDFLECSEDWVQAAVKAKGLGDYPGGAGQEWLAGTTPTIRNLRLLKRTLEQIKKYGHPKVPGRVHTHAGGQVIASVFPGDAWDKLLFAGTTAEVWMQPGVTQERLHRNMAAAYRNPPEKCEISLVLGAGNVASIAPMDCFYKLFVEKKLTLLKAHPVNDYLGPFLTRGMRCLIERGFCAIVYGGAQVGDYCCKHELVDEIHITGSDKTHDVIVFGPDVAENKAARKVQNPKPITSELGNVSPMIIVPGDWSPSEIKYQAENILSSLANNAGFNCNATRVLITQKGWKQRDAFLGALREVMKNHPTRPAYYPGADNRFDAFMQQHPDAETYGSRENGHLPWTLITDVDPNRQDELCFSMEAFCGLFSETMLEAESTAAFIDKAVDFANDSLWGTLSGAMIIDPRTAKQPDVAAAFDRAMANMRFGTVGVNLWPALGYAICSATWGAFPGHDIYDIQSGRDVVHNTLMFDKPEKTVIKGPFTQKPKPAWFVTHKAVDALGRNLTRFEAGPSLFKLPGLLISALKG
ncbi:MAG: aldehyde dehydrogenase family protein [Acidobacteriota bacterium]|nr:aldehyde dehydrogenase family protein [Acidobacteriota bacterium]